MTFVLHFCVRCFYCLFLLHSYNPSLNISGSCTACVVALHYDESKIYTANLGDSGFLVIRRGEVIHRSEEQQHYFNTPFQLSVAPTVLEGVVLSDRFVCYIRCY